MIKGKAIAGELEGDDLVELPVSEKMQWRNWNAKHPDTLVLSVLGREDARNSYHDHFVDTDRFEDKRRRQATVDERAHLRVPPRGGRLRG